MKIFGCITLFLVFSNAIDPDIQCQISEHSEGNRIYSCPQLNITIKSNRKSRQSNVGVWPLYVSDNPVDLDSVPRLESIDRQMESFIVNFYSVEIPRNGTFTEIIQALGIGVEKVFELHLEGCINVTNEQLMGLDHLWKLYISGSIFERQTTSIGFLLPQLRTLSMKLNILRDPPTLESLPFLEELILEFNKIKAIRSGYLQHSKFLDTLLINEWELESVPEDLFHDLKELEVLTYRSNVNGFPSLKGLSNVKVLILQVPEGNVLQENLLKDLINLQNLNLFSCDIKKIAVDAFKTNSKLIYIDISYNLLQELPNDIFKNNPELLKMDVSYNNLTNFSDTILPSRIKVLNARYTNISSFNISRRLDNLHEIDLSDSNIIGELNLMNLTRFYPKLRHFSLSNNLITHVIVPSNLYVDSADLMITLKGNKIEKILLETCKHGWLRWFLSKYKIQFDFSLNPLRCDCEMKSFQNYLKLSEASISVIRDVQCRWPEGETLLRIDWNSTNC